MEIFIHRNGQDLGPYSPREIRDRIAAGQLFRTDLAWYEGAADWMPLSEVHLPPEVEATLVVVPSRAPTTVEPRSLTPVQPATKACPFCAEPIKPDALKCKHCGEILDPRLRAAEEARRAAEVSRRATAIAPAAAPSQVNVKVNVGSTRPVIIKERRTGCLGRGCLLLIAGFFVLSLLGRMGNNRPENPSPLPTVAPSPADYADSIAASQQAAVAKHPQLGIQGSPFNVKFRTTLARWQARNDRRLRNPNWPELLADECATSP